ncbi:hypothetical protein K469DRAFT_682276 [Zopfia rhizophila CBS 207.26]|uniref:Uncharacterized protein n=1 Tax=Zopfia rhizophila CBS 207.26 TaxID=1314779 RepID=A0A6A6EHQ2_9PEZI|nr:hypothetical protein K469DRAFT_682276 [Zopfia rhizophila CBS 207.26]
MLGPLEFTTKILRAVWPELNLTGNYALRTVEGNGKRRMEPFRQDDIPQPGYKWFTAEEVFMAGMKSAMKRRSAANGLFEKDKVSLQEVATSLDIQDQGEECPIYCSDVGSENAEPGANTDNDDSEDEPITCLLCRNGQCKRSAKVETFRNKGRDEEVENLWAKDEVNFWLRTNLILFQRGRPTPGSTGTHLGGYSAPSPTSNPASN